MGGRGTCGDPLLLVNGTANLSTRAPGGKAQLGGGKGKKKKESALRLGTGEPQEEAREGRGGDGGAESGAKACILYFSGGISPGEGPKRNESRKRGRRGVKGGVRGGVSLG